MTAEEINETLNKDYEDFLNDIYKDRVPGNIIEMFEKSIMALPPFAHKINFYKVKAIISKNPDELSNSDINDVIKAVLNVPLERLYDSLYDAIPEHIKFEKFVRDYNDHIENFKKKLNMKKTNLTNLSSGVLNKNGMKIIPRSDY